MFSDLLTETKSFKYQITLKATLKKYKSNGEIKFAPVYFNSTTKTVINHKFSLQNAFQEILYKIDNWIKKGSGWIVELIESQYINMSTYRLLSGSSYVQLPVELRNSKKGLISIKNNDQKCLLWCYVRHVHPVKIHPERITGKDKKFANDLDYDGVEYPVREKDFSKIETKNNICVNVFCYENKLTFPIYISDQEFEKSIELLLVMNKNWSHYMYIKDFDRFMFHKMKNKNKKYFCKSCLKCFSSKNVLKEHKKVCLSINGAQSVRLEKETNEFKKYFKQIPFPFKIYADFECNLESVESYQGSYSKNIKITFLVVLFTNFFELIMNLVSRLLFLEVKILLMNLLKQFLQSISM